VSEEGLLRAGFRGGGVDTSIELGTSKRCIREEMPGALSRFAAVSEDDDDDGLKLAAIFV